jgi:hypothetical protein
MMTRCSRRWRVKGNGTYAFIDSEQEARRVFVDDLSATLNTIAEDVKIQVEYNPDVVLRFRQLGYESRQLTREQFRDDTVDAGEIGSGQSVTALYELDLMQSMVPVRMRSVRGRVDERWLAVVRVRYRRVDNGRIEEIEQRIYERDIATIVRCRQSAVPAGGGRGRLCRDSEGQSFCAGRRVFGCGRGIAPGCTGRCIWIAGFVNWHRSWRPQADWRGSAPWGVCNWLLEAYKSFTNV